MEPTHAIVQFVDDETICCVPIKMVDLGQSEQPQLASLSGQTPKKNKQTFQRLVRLLLLKSDNQWKLY